MANGYRKITVESDNLIVIHVLRRASPDLSYLALIIEECLQLGCNFEDIGFVHIHRACYHVAHELAKLAFHSEFVYPLP